VLTYIANVALTTRGSTGKIHCNCQGAGLWLSQGSGDGCKAREGGEIVNRLFANWTAVRNIPGC
jgi:hypothetical protein